jgi:quercetin dioxygenase-like cupin family protein
MKIQGIPFCTTDWDNVPSTEHLGTSGKALWRTFEVGNVRARIVEYSAGYVADHWCDRGHVLYVLEGEITTELKNGKVFVLHPGMSYQVADGTDTHRSSSKDGAKLFIVD